MCEGVNVLMNVQFARAIILTQSVYHSYFCFMKKHSIIALLLLVFVFPAFSQKKDIKVIWFLGYALTADSLIGIPKVHITIRDRGRVAEGGPDGYFSFPAVEGDTLILSATDYLSVVYLVPFDLESERYSLLQPMATTADYLSPTYIFPRQKEEKFTNFYCPRIPKSDSTLAKEKLKRNLTNTKFYYRYEMPQNISNPTCWAQFLQAYENGDFKKSNRVKNLNK